MCHKSILDFFGTELSTTDIEGQRILEVGSRDVNGGVRNFLMSLGARHYVGVDLEPGPGVDRLCDVANLASEFSGEFFDVVVTTEMLEHVRDWRSAVSNLKHVVAPGGLLVITTRSFGFPYHDFPGDYWRYELSDMERLFQDFQIVKLIPDPQFPGVFLKCRKPTDFREVDVSEWKLHSVVEATRSDATRLTDQEIGAYANRMEELTRISSEVAQILMYVDLTDVGRRDFRDLWRSAERLSDQIVKLTPGSDSSRAAWARGAGRIRRHALDFLTAARLARGRFFGPARRALLESAAGETAENVFRIPWAVVGDDAFREILGTLRLIRTLCLKVQSYARPRVAD